MLWFVWCRQTAIVTAAFFALSIAQEWYGVHQPIRTAALTALWVTIYSAGWSLGAMERLEDTSNERTKRHIHVKIRLVTLLCAWAYDNLHEKLLETAVENVIDSIEHSQHPLVPLSDEGYAELVVEFLLHFLAAVVFSLVLLAYCKLLPKYAQTVSLVDEHHAVAADTNSHLALAARLLAEHEDAVPHDGGAGDGGDDAAPGRGDDAAPGGGDSHAPSSLPAGGRPPRAALSRQSSTKAWQPLDVLGASGSDAGRLPVSAPTEKPSLKADLDADAALGRLRTELAAALARVGGLEEELAAARDDGGARLALTTATATRLAAAETPEMLDAAGHSPLSAGRSIEFFTPDNSESCARSAGCGHSDAAGDRP